MSDGNTLIIEKLGLILLGRIIDNMIPFLGALVERVVHDFLDIGTPLKQFTDTVLTPPQHPIEREQVNHIKFIFIYFHNSAFCSLSDKPTNKIFIE